MTERKRCGVVLPFPRERLARRRRVQPPPMKRLPMGTELRAYIEGMAGKGVTR
jgi:hypothetical protein